MKTAKKLRALVFLPIQLFNKIFLLYFTYWKVSKIQKTGEKLILISNLHRSTTKIRLLVNFIEGFVSILVGGSRSLMFILCKICSSRVYNPLEG